MALRKIALQKVTAFVDGGSDRFAALIEQEDDMYVSHCPKLEIASQGKTVAEALANLQEAVELFFEYADEQEIEKEYAS